MVHWGQVPRCWQCRVQGGLCEERPGLPSARHRWFQLAPTNPPQGTAEPLSQDGGASGKTYLRKDKMLPGSEEKVRNIPASTRGRAGGG